MLYVILCDVYCIVLCCIVLYYTVLYCPALHCSTQPTGTNPCAVINNNNNNNKYINLTIFSPIILAIYQLTIYLSQCIISRPPEAC